MSPTRLLPLPIWNAFGLRPIRALAWLVLLGATAVLVRAEAARTTTLEGVSEQVDIIYRRTGNRDVRLDIYRPDTPAPHGGRPAVLVIHGGGWRGGSKRDVRSMAIQLAANGYVVVAIDYQLSRPGKPSWPANFEDSREAVRWVRRHASEYGVDAERIAALGVSAGGHLASMLGTYPDGPIRPDTRMTPPAADDSAADISARVQAVVNFYGPVDLSGSRSSLPLPSTPVNLMLGRTRAERPGRYEAASPVHHVSPDDAPTLLIHGREDQLIPLEQSEALAGALQTARVNHQLIVVEGAAHGFGFHVGGRNILPDVLTFLDSMWNVKAEKLER